MKKLCLLAFTFFHLSVAMSQHEKATESKITNVTVFLDRAQVTREVKMRVDAGKTDIVITGLTSQLDEQSIQVSGKGAFILLGIGHRQNYLNELNMPKSLKSLKDSIELLQRQIDLENNQKEILNKEEQMLMSNQKIGGANQNLSAAELKAMADFFRARLSEIASSRVKVDLKVKKLNEELLKLQRQFDTQNDVYMRNTSEIIVSVSADAPTVVDLDVSYIVSNAGWSAIYDLRAINTKTPIQLSYKANVFQSTGEEWKNVRLKLSTANPSLGGVKPELHTWYLDFYQSIENALQGKTAGVAVMRSAPAMDKQMDEPSAGVSSPSESISDYVTAVQTTLNTEFEISLPYTVNSTNQPTVVDIQKHELKAEYTYAVAPKLDKDAFLMAKATGWEDLNLLPGAANIFFEGTFVAKSYIDPNNIKDTLAISLGRDKRIVVKREKMKDFTSRKFIGSNQRESYAYEISIRNTKTEPIKILVEDQMPVSQNSQIEVTQTDPGGAKIDNNTGKMTWELSLQPNETKKLTFKFDVKYPKDKVISGL
jgi:uncharacterized protein (TIGR02231 family)